MCWIYNIFTICIEYHCRMIGMSALTYKEKQAYTATNEQ